MKWINIKQTDDRLYECMPYPNRVGNMSDGMRMAVMMALYYQYETRMSDTDLQILEQYPMLCSMNKVYIISQFQ
jgi:hypothetical protein